ncbi:MAG: class A beta-lactamase-related serine hydrolase [Gammaproteobacteria bacterium]|nr:MAG: class A beta-lactamase-related serine hydrolase [Gammaproteobacteria bacterium]
MKRVRNFFTKLLSIFSAQGSAHSIVLSLAFMCLAPQVYGQDEKRISYPVNIQVERAVSSAPEIKPLPVEQTQEDAIRALYETASTSSSPRRAAKQRDKTNTKSAKIEKKSSSKSSSKIVANKKTAETKPEQKLISNATPMTQAPPPSIAKSLTVINENSQAVTATPSEILPSTNSMEAAVSGLPVTAENTVSNAEAAKNIASVGATNETVVDDDGDLGDEISAENMLTEGTAEAAAAVKDTAPDGETLPVQPDLADPAAVAPTVPVVAAVKNIPLPMSNAREAYITEFKKYVEAKIVPRLPGIAIAIIADGKVKVLQAYGVKKAGGRDFIDTDTAFRLASCSKTIAGTTAGILVNEGVLSWTTPVVSVLPNIQFSNPRYGNQLSLRDILSQSTGLPTHSGDNYIEDGLPFDSVVQKLKSVNFVCPPGKCYAYQNVSFSLFDGMVRNKTGKPYEQYVQEKLFNPLGMQTASFGLAGLKAHNNYALPHVATSKGWYTEKITENYYRMHPAAGANASITDMARWVLAQMGQNPDVLAPNVLNAVHDKVTKNTPSQSHYGAREGVTDTHYGIGWRVFDYRGDKNFVHHGGYVLGFQSQMVFNKELKIGMVALSNSNKMPTNIIFDFLDAYEDEKRGPRKIILPSVSPLAKKRPAQKGR